MELSSPLGTKPYTLVIIKGLHTLSCAYVNLYARVYSVLYSVCMLEFSTLRVGFLENGPTSSISVLEAVKLKGSSLLSHRIVLSL